MGAIQREGVVGQVTLVAAVLPLSVAVGLAFYGDDVDGTGMLVTAIVVVLVGYLLVKHSARRASRLSIGMANRTEARHNKQPLVRDK
jgi:hypothetical protein